MRNLYWEEFIELPRSIWVDDESKFSVYSVENERLVRWCHRWVWYNLNTNANWEFKLYVLKKKSLYEWTVSLDTDIFIDKSWLIWILSLSLTPSGSSVGLMHPSEFNHFIVMHANMCRCVTDVHSMDIISFSETDC